MKALKPNECNVILAKNYIGRIGYLSKGRAEIIPITYYYDAERNSILTYSGQGNKINAIRENPLVSFQVDEIASLEKWQSVLLYGRFEELTGIDAKFMLRLFSEGVKKVITEKEKSCPDFIKNFSSKTTNADAPIVYRILIEEINGKKRDT